MNYNSRPERLIVKMNKLESGTSFFPLIFLMTGIYRMYRDTKIVSKKHEKKGSVASINPPGRSTGNTFF